MSAPSARRAALELGALATLSTLYLALFPRRPPGVDVALAAAAAGTVGAAGWRRRHEAASGRDPRASRLLLGATLAAVGLFGFYGEVDAWAARGQWADVVGRLAPPRFFLALGLFGPWALVRQVLFQGYLLGRWRALLRGSVVAVPVLLNGFAFGAVHLPEWDVALLTALGGIAWSATYARDGRLAPVTASHATLGVTYYYWLRGQDRLAPAG